MAADLLDHALRLALGPFGYRSRTVPTAAGDTHVLEVEGAGALAPVVLVHGLGSSALQSLPFVRRLRPHVRRVVAVDLPGHGFSARPDTLTLRHVEEGLLGALDAVQDAPAVLVGNSLGGAAALRCANARPARALGLVLLSPGGAPMDAAELAALRRTFELRTLAEARDFVERLLARDPGPVGWLVAARVRRTLRDPLLQRWLADVTDADWLRPEEVARAPARTALYWGGAETVLPASGFAFWSAHLPATARIVRPPGRGHSPQLDADPLAVDLVLDAAR